MFTRLTCLMVATLVAGCGQMNTGSNSDTQKPSTSQTTSKTSSKTSSKSSSTSKTTSTTHVHEWETEWSYDEQPITTLVRVVMRRKMLPHTFYQRIIKQLI